MGAARRAKCKVDQKRNAADHYMDLEIYCIMSRIQN